MRPAIIILAAIMALSTASCTQESGGAMTKLKQWLWPQRVVVPVPAPKAPPIEVAPKVEVPPAIAPPIDPRVFVAPPAPPKIKPKPKAKPKIDDGPNLPYPCWLVRLHAAGKTDAQLEAIRVANGVTLTPKQTRQAQECLRGLPR